VNGTLPLQKGKRILVTGPNADSIRALNGGWTSSWQGDVAPLFETYKETIQEAVRDYNGENNTVFIAGVSYNNSGKYWEEYEDRIEQAVAVAKTVDVILCVVGENSYTEKPGDLQDMELSPKQLKLVARLAESGKPIVLVLNEGRPRLITKIVNYTSAIVDILLPGSYGAGALCDLLFGNTNFAGRLPFSYPKYRHNLMTYIHKHGEISYPHEGDGSFMYNSAYDPLFRFGYGLSYTTFEYSDLRISESVWKTPQTRFLNVSVAVKNTGKRSGTETVLLYSSDLYASVAPDVKRLRKFEQITLDPGESKVVTFSLTAADLSFVNRENKRVTEPGEFSLSIADRAVDINLRSTYDERASKGKRKLV
jgi:beta-glucosidase